VNGSIEIHGEQQVERLVWQHVASVKALLWRHAVPQDLGAIITAGTCPLPQQGVVEGQPIQCCWAAAPAVAVAVLVLLLPLLLVAVLAAAAVTDK